MAEATAGGSYCTFPVKTVKMTELKIKNCTELGEEDERRSTKFINTTTVTLAVRHAPA